MIQVLKPIVKSNATFVTDERSAYRTKIREAWPGAEHDAHKGRRGCVTGQGELKRGGWDPLFALNHTAATLRARMSRLIRRTWNTTKSIEYLQAHLRMYQLYHNHIWLPRVNMLKHRV